MKNLTPILTAESFKNLPPLPESHFNFQNEIAGKLAADFDTIILEGLKRKGFTFNSRKATELFIEEHCKKVENELINEHIFLVDETPFLKVDYSPKIQIEENKVSTSLGDFTYL